MNTTREVLKGFSNKKDFKKALEELALQLHSKEAEFTILFISNEYAVKNHEKDIADILGPNVVGCSTAGEISPGGIEDFGVVGMSLFAPHFKCHLICLNDLKNFPQPGDSDILEELDHINEAGIKGASAAMKTFSLLLLDGLSCREEIVTGTLGVHLPKIPLVGASSGDGLLFKETFIYCRQKFSSNQGILLFVATDLPFEVFKLQHFTATDKKLVVTQSNPKERIVYEIDGELAADAYSQLLDLKVNHFDAEVFSTYPVMLKIGEENFVRSIQKVNPDKSLTFYCAIDDGIVLTLAEKEDLYQTTKAGLQEIQAQVGGPVLTIMFECILRRLEILSMEAPKKQAISQLYASMNSVGFHTYGEQFGPLHINQTLTGVMIGRPRNEK